METAARYTGAWVRRREDPRLLTGLGNYVDDIKVPGALHSATHFESRASTVGHQLERSIRRALTPAHSAVRHHLS